MPVAPTGSTNVTTGQPRPAFGSAVTAVDTGARTVTLADGSTVDYGELVIATGLVPKRIPSFPDLPGIHVLRNYGESQALRSEAATARRAAGRPRTSPCRAR